jgi:hypothetical protein
MAIDCVATVFGAELTSGPLAKFLRVAEGAGNNGGAKGALASLIIDDEAQAEALGQIAPVAGGVEVGDGGGVGALQAGVGSQEFLAPGVGHKPVGTGSGLTVLGGAGVGALAAAQTFTPNASTSNSTANTSGLSALSIAQEAVPAAAAPATLAAAPEPATWTMLLLGIGAVGAALRRARAAARHGL